MNADWEYRSLGEVVDILDRQRVPVSAKERAARTGTVPYYGATGQVGTIDSAIFDEPLVLLGEDGVQFFDPLKPKAYLIDGPTWVNNHAHVLRARKNIDRRFLAHYLNFFEYRSYANGTTRLKLTQAAMKTIPIPIPTLDEQRRIVGRIDEYFSSLEAGQALVRQTMAHLGKWRVTAVEQAILSAGTWKSRRLRELLREPMRNGRSDRAVERETTGTRCLTLTAVTQTNFGNENTKLTTTTPKIAAGLWLEPGDILVQRSNTPELVGTSARYDGPRNWAIYPDLLIRVRCDESILDSRFLATILQTERVHRFFRSRAKGLAGSMPKIDQETVGMAPIPLPPLPVQRQVVSAVADIYNRADNLVQTLDTAQRRSVALRRSILTSAFEGHLTRQRPHFAVVAPDLLSPEQLTLIPEASLR